MRLLLPQSLAGSTAPPGVLVFGDLYVHCGQPMQRLGPEVRRIGAPGISGGRPEEAFGVRVSSQVLRCSCGFQMDVLDQE